MPKAREPFVIQFLKKLFNPDPSEFDGDPSGCNGDPMSQLAIQIFIRAEQEGATSILFGVPTGESYDRESAEFYEQTPDEEVREFARSQGLDVKEPEPFEISPIPIFLNIENEWRMVFDIPMCLHTSCIEYIKSFSTDFTTATMNIEMPLEESNAIFKFNTNENFNYIASELKFEKKSNI